MADTYKLTTLKLFSSTTDSTTYLYPNIVWENLPVSVRKRITDLENATSGLSGGKIDASNITNLGTEITDKQTLPVAGNTIYAYVNNTVTNAISDYKNADIQVADTLPTASKDTIGTIYLVAHDTHSNGSGAAESVNDYYDEYITVTIINEIGQSYSWEKIGNTDIDLSDYYTKTETDEAIQNATSNIASASTVEALQSRIAILEGYINALTGATIATATAQSNVSVQANAINDASLANTSAITTSDTDIETATPSLALGADTHITA